MRNSNFINKINYDWQKLPSDEWTTLKYVSIVSEMKILNFLKFITHGRQHKI